MSDNSLTYEIARMMQDRSLLQHDMAEAVDLVKNLFQKKYVAKLHDAVRVHQLQIKQNPPKEAQLLQAMKAFMDPDRHQQVDQLIDSFMMMNTLQSMRQEMSGYANASLRAEGKPTERKAPPLAAQMMDSSVHEDGVYDVDDACLVNRNSQPGNNLFALLAMVMAMGKI